MPLPFGCYQRWNVCGGRWGADVAAGAEEQPQVPSRGISRMRGCGNS